MSDVMLFGVLNMPYDLAMADDLSRVQFYGRAREAAGKIAEMRKLLFRCAPSFQGGHSDIGDELSDVLGIPFPVDMPSLEKQAKAEGLDPAELWPWLAKMRAGV